MQESTIYRRRERLSKITGELELEDAYSTTIERIKAQGGDKSRLGIATLMWISHAERPMRVDELCHALAVDLGSKDFNADNIPSISTLVGCCQGLVTVDKEGSTVRLIHFTLQEYLSASPDIFSKPHSAMAEICLTYLNSEQVKSIRADIFPNIPDTPFLKYCSLYWGVHAKRELSDCARSLALELFKEYHDHISIKLLLAERLNLDRWDLRDFDSGYPFSGLHCASFFGICDLVSALIGMECYDINKVGFWEHTPPAWAALNGHEEVVKLLLERGEVDLNKPDNFGNTPLSQAAYGGHEGVVKILLEQEDVYPDMPDRYGRTPLSHAAGCGHEGVVTILLRREEVNLNKLTSWDRTPLSYAAMGGHEGVVKVLLGREEVNPDNPGTNGRTPLSYAAGDGHAAVVNILLGHEEVNPHKLDNTDRTPLAHAAQKGHKDVVKLLFAYEEANPDKPDTWGLTLLWHAAASGDEGAAKILLEREEFNPDKPDSDGRTLLSYAASNGHEGVVKILLRRK